MRAKKLKLNFVIIILTLLISFVSGISMLLLSKNIFNQNKLIIDTNAVTGPQNTEGSWIDEGNIADDFSLGSGKENDPYIISTEKELARLSYLVYNGNNFANTYFKQNNNLDMSEYYWQPIGVYYDKDGNIVQRYFSGNYDGGEFTISGLFTPAVPQDATTQQQNAFSNQGLFGYVSSSTNSLIIKNITIENSFIQGYKHVGGILGSMSIINYSDVTNFEISNCINYAQISANSEYAGGIAGQMLLNGNTKAKVLNCTNYGEITAVGNYVGGIAGNSNYISSCSNYGNINVAISTTHYDIYVGGVAGSGEINSCKNYGNLNIVEINNENSRNIFIGGLLGQGEVINSLNKGAISLSETGSDVTKIYVGGIVGSGSAENCNNDVDISYECNIGGIVGKAVGNVANCYNIGSIIGNGYVGGLVGSFDVPTFESLVLKDCYNSGQVLNNNQTENSATGGLIGIVNSNSREQILKIVNSYNKGEINSTNYVGGLIGKISIYGTDVIDSSGSLISCFNVGNVVGTNYVGAIVGAVLINSDVDYPITNCYYGGENLSSLKAIGNDYVADISYLSNITTLAKTETWYTDSSNWNKIYSWDFDGVWGFVDGQNDGYPVFEVTEKQYWTDSGIRALTFAGGDGTDENPFLISNGKQLGYLAAVVNGITEDSRAEKYTNDLGFTCYFDGKYFKQTQNIDLSAYYWNPIGTGDLNSMQNNAFAGNYDGGNFSITGIKTASASIQGLFGFISNSSQSYTTIENVNIENSNFKATSAVGGIIGMCYAYNVTIKNCHNSATIIGDCPADSGGAGGIIGACLVMQSGLVEDCSNSGEIIGTEGAGGIAGLFGAMEEEASVVIQNCFNEGQVTGAGICYSFSNAKIKNCYNIGVITKSAYTSGIIANGYRATIEDCYNNGQIIGNEFVAGILGYNYNSTVYGCHNTGDITGKGKYVGGIAAGSDVDKSYNSGIIIGGSYVGGITGNGSATNCYNVGTVTATGDYVGGIVGNGYAKVCYNTASVSGNNYVGGIVGQANNSEDILNCINIGMVIKNGTDVNNYLGAIAGYSNSASYIKNCFYGGDCPNSIPDIGGGVTASSVYEATLNESIKSLSWFNDNMSDINHMPYIWDFLAVWGFEEGVNNNYPIFEEADFWTNEENRATSFAGGTGTENDPYLIETPGQLAYLSYLVMSGEGENHKVDSYDYNSYYSGCYFKQIANIDLSGHVWRAIGTAISSDVYRFSGNYDGGNYTISGIETVRTLSMANYPQGLFGWIHVEDGTSVEIKNINIKNSSINGVAIAGGIVAMFEGGDNYSTISNCTVEGEIYCMYQENSAEAGGIVGKVTGNLNITNCVNNANVESNGMAGGIVSSASASLSMNLILSQSQIINCINNGNITGTNKVGGIAGSTGANISECYNTGLISGNQDVGGIVGHFSGGGKQQYYNNESFKSTLQDCYNTGDIVGQSYVGGIIGFASSTYLALANTYNKESVSGESNVGGILGGISIDSSQIETNIYRNYNVASVNGTTNVGAVFGLVNSGSIQNRDNEYGGDCPSTMAGVGSGTLYTTYVENLDQKAKDISYYISDDITDEYYWDFGAVWGFDSLLNDGYPVFVDVEFWTDPGLRGDSLKGTGTENDPYLISSAKDLAYLAYCINNSISIKTENSTTLKTPDSSTYFEQTANIDLSQYYWEPIGWSYDLTKQFNSNYDGGNFTIKGLKTVERAQSSLAIQGLFSLIVTLNDSIYLKNINISAPQLSGLSVGALAGMVIGNQINISNCHTYLITDNYYSTGGLIGSFSANFATVENCSAYGIITEKENLEAEIIASGGLIGTASGNTNFINCSSSVTITGKSNIGGFIGMVLPSNNQTLNFNNCFATATLTATGDNVGGFIGNIKKDNVNYTCAINIADSGFEGYINSESATTGAFIGSINDVETNISNCYAVADISSNSTLTDLDFIGNLSIGVISNCVYVIDKNGTLAKKYIGSDFSAFVWGNTNICPIPKNLYWYGDFVNHDVTFDITGGISNWQSVSK